MPLNNENNNDCCKCTTPQYELTLNQQGPQGKTGPQGEPGFSPRITVNTNTPSTYILTINTIDGEIVTPNLKAPFPLGGTTGQVLMKSSNTDGDYNWGSIPYGTPYEAGIVQMSTIEDTEPDESGEIDTSTVINPSVLVEYVDDKLTTELSNLVTLDTEQTITGLKTFSNDTGILTNSIKEIENGSTIITYNTDTSNILIGSTGNNTTNITLRTSSDGTLKYAKGSNVTYNILTDGDIATTTTPGIVKPDGTTITISADGTLSSVGGITEIPQATATTLGGIKANEKQDTDTQEVRIDTATGLLYTQPGSVPNIIDGGNANTTSVIPQPLDSYSSNDAIVNNGYTTTDVVTVEDEQ